MILSGKDKQNSLRARTLPCSCFIIVQDLTPSNICRCYHYPGGSVTLLTRVPTQNPIQPSLEAHGLTPSRCLCDVRTRTHSLWSGLSQPKEQRKLRNPLYVPNPLAIWPSAEPQSLRLWQGDPPPPPWGSSRLCSAPLPGFFLLRPVSARDPST